MFITNENLQGWVVVKANTIAAASGFVAKDLSRPILNAMCIEVNDDGTTVTATDSYRLGHFRSKNFGVRGTNPKGTKILLPWRQVKASKLVPASPKKSLWLAMRHVGRTIELMLLDDNCTAGYALVGQLTIDDVEGNFPDYRMLDNRREYAKKPATGTARTESPGLNTSYLIDVLRSFEKAVSDTGACVTQFEHRGLLEPIHFTARNTSGEEAWAMVMPVRL